MTWFMGRSWNLEAELGEIRKTELISHRGRCSTVQKRFESVGQETCVSDFEIPVFNLF